jgi:translocation and assembly module TamB
VRIANVQQRTTEGQITGQTDTRVEIGRYVGDRIYLSYAHVFGASDTQNSNEAQIEYRLTGRWIVETVLGDSGVGGIDALWTHRY